LKFDPLEIDVPRLLSGLGISAEHEGDRWIALCPSPDHADSSPSWDMKDSQGTARHGLHRCFSCGYGGTATRLVADRIQCDEFYARDWILENCMGEAPIVQSIDIKLKSIDQQFQLPPGTIVAPLEEWPAAPQAYTIGRHVTPTQVTRWGLGYCLTGPMFGRIIIPVRDQLGVLRSYTGRTYIDSPKRYKEPSREEGFLPGAIFGEEHWPPLNQRNLVCVVEGSLKAMAIERVAPSLAVASTMGTQVELSHLQKLSTFKGALLMTDNDYAGDRAAEKLKMALARHLKMVDVQLEPGTDADSIEPADLRARLVQAYRNLV
jgi:5S rRNA maturation endonuclease (ribonuclease M5)